MAAERGVRGAPKVHTVERQWGRGRVAAERLRKPVRTDNGQLASMGPRPSGRGTWQGRRRLARGRWRQWGRGRVAAERLMAGLRVARAAASMGPRPSGRGTVPATRLGRTSVPRQWGRGRVAAERSAGPLAIMPPVCVNGAAAEWPRNARRCHGLRSGAPASMGPRPSGRGTGLPQQGAGLNGPASMGPRPSGRGTFLGSSFSSSFSSGVNGAAAEWPRNEAASFGRRHRARSVNGAAAEWPRNVIGAGGVLFGGGMRQWGRGRVAAERRPSLALLGAGTVRQWGRGRVAAERLSCRPCRRAPPRVNGAAAEWPRNEP